MFWQIIKKNSPFETLNNIFFRDLKIYYTAIILAFLIANISGSLFFNPRLLAFQDLFWGGNRSLENISQGISQAFDV